MGRRAKKPVQCAPAQQTVYAPITETVVTLQHSLELVRTVITATISHIVWARRIFPPEIKYHLRTYDPADPDMTYEGFVNGGKKRETLDPKEDLMTWHVLKRGQSQDVDKLLHCLEIGAGDALEKGFLAKLTLSLHHADGSISDENLFEAYAMTFIYGPDDQVSKVSSGVREGGKPETSPMVMFDAKMEAKTLVDDISSSIIHIIRAGDLEKLPEQFRMSIALLYNDKAPPDYQPPDFKAGDEGVSRIIEMSEVADNIKMKTGFHEVTAGHGIRRPIILKSSSQRSSQSRDLQKEGAPSYPSTLCANSVEVRESEHQLLQRRFSASPDLGNTQPEAVQQIQGMGFARLPNSATQDTQRLSNGEPATFDHLSQAASVPKTQALPIFPPYTQAVTTALREHLLNTRSSRDDALDDPYPQEEFCECNGPKNRDITVLCSFCKVPQHPECYGYLENDQPDTFICYKCLLQDQDPERLDQVMKPLCVKRRALYYLLKKGTIYKHEELVEHLNRDIKFVSGLLSELHKEGYLKGQGLGKKKDKPIFTYVGLIDDLRKNYFRPQQGIDHLFALPKKLLLTGVGVLNRRDSPPPHAPADARNLAYQHPSKHSSVAQRMIADDSSTQGTPSPRPVSGRITSSASRDLSTATPMQSKLSEDFPITSKKRKMDIGEIDRVKRNNMGARSPWLIDRKSQ